MDNVANAVGRVPDFIPCARLARRVEYAPQRMDLCGRLRCAGRRSRRKQILHLVGLRWRVRE
jgi:hypothetical protein